MVQVQQATQAGGPLESADIELGPLRADHVEIEVSSCGLCHSDLSLLDDTWGDNAFPLVPGHEAVGRVVELGSAVRHLEVGQTVGVGWTSASCLTCDQCLAGDHNLCRRAEATAVGRPGGFADRLQAQAVWAIPIPDGVDTATAGPLFCGGITVFNPIVQFGIMPTDRVGVVGIGGLGHLALQFLAAWGCEVTAFSSSADKVDEAKSLGAHRVVNSRDDAELKAERGRHDAIISTVNVELPWRRYISALRPRGRLITVGMVPEPIPALAGPLVNGQKVITGSPIGSPATQAKMLDFCARHGIAPMTEHLPMERANEAFDRLRTGSPRYRMVLDN